MGKVAHTTDPTNATRRGTAPGRKGELKIMLPKLMLLLAFILTLTNIFELTAISWWIIGVLVAIPVVLALIAIAGVISFWAWLNK